MHMFAQHRAFRVVSRTNTQCGGREGPVRAAHRGHGAPRPLPVALRASSACTWRRVDGKRLKFLRDVLGARVWRLHRAYRFACSPFIAGFMELKHSERRQLKTAGSVVAERVVKLTQNAIFGRCCMNPDKFRNTNAYMDPAKFERAVGKSSVTNFELQINDSEGFLAFVETLKTDRSKACMSVPTQVGARTLQLSKLMMRRPTTST